MISVTERERDSNLRSVACQIRSCGNRVNNCVRCAFASRRTLTLEILLPKTMKDALDALKTFRDERDWKQFHDPKNLAAALGIEAAELNEVFLWKGTEESYDVDVAKVREELADVLAYALLLADTFNLDPEEIVLEKVAANALKYPVDKARGVATKYTDL